MTEPIATPKTLQIMVKLSESLTIDGFYTLSNLILETAKVMSDVYLTHEKLTIARKHLKKRAELN